MKPGALLLEIRRFCRHHASAARARRYERYFVEGYDAYGVEQQTAEAQRERWLASHRDDLGLKGFLALGDLLVESGKYEEGSYAIWFAAAFREEFTPATLERLGRWLDKGLRNWAHIDFICAEVLSHFLTRRIVPLRAFSSWRTSPSKWRRRAVPVTLIKPVRAGLPVGGPLALIAPMMKDEEKVVQQGLGWFLREAWKKHPREVEAFLMKWKEVCGRLIVRYATERMSAAERARFRRSERTATRRSARGGGAGAAARGRRRTGASAGRR